MAKPSPERNDSGLPRVCVIMSVYNGSKYLKEQIDSILAQDGVKVHLFIRDDGSTDDTYAVLQSYSQGVEIRTGTNKGAAMGFIEAAFAAPIGYDYYAFSDADDVWLSSKLINAIQMIEERTEPTLYGSALKLVDNELNDLGVILKSEGPLEFRHALAQGGIGGATSVLNESLFILLRTAKPKIVAMHDNWVYLIASAFGSIVYDDRSFILYRQHGNNTVGGGNGFKTRWKRRIQSIRNGSAVQLSQAKEFRRLYGSSLDNDKKSILERYANLDESAINRIRFATLNGLIYNSVWSRIFNSAIAMIIPRIKN